MFGSESDFDEQSGLLRNGKRYKRTLGSYILRQNIDYTSLSPEEYESEETPQTILDGNSIYKLHTKTVEL